MKSLRQWRSRRRDAIAGLLGDQYPMFEFKTRLAKAKNEEAAAKKAHDANPSESTKLNWLTAQNERIEAEEALQSLPVAAAAPSPVSEVLIETPVRSRSAVSTNAAPVRRSQRETPAAEIGEGVPLLAPSAVAGPVPDSQPQPRVNPPVEDSEPAALKPRRREPTPAEVARNDAIEKALETPVPMKFAQETPLREFLEYVRKSLVVGDGGAKQSVPIYVDRLAFAQYDAVKPATMESPILIELEGIPLRVTLRLALDQLGLDYRVRDQMIFISSPQRIERLEAIDAGKPFYGYGGMGGMGGAGMGGMGGGFR
jgi:hypothetical protein